MKPMRAENPRHSADDHRLGELSRHATGGRAEFIIGARGDGSSLRCASQLQPTALLYAVSAALPNALPALLYPLDPPTRCRKVQHIKLSLFSVARYLIPNAR
ncbi:hypothetical protein PoB_005245100 [Plakobranchus ocellatus]|uniref:Uncharacterized protein n=1 Tax=Plakobranchus ocellatus TaxID=259542 RepID=A0AAV4BRT4_9GAST|nr:hypothetical protein PoB_005245100 [Plakobranchus ocellatus]